MSYRLLRTRTVKVRKPRDCHWCGEPCGPGDTVVVQTGVWYGGVQSETLHPECHAGMQASYICEDDGWELYGQGRGCDINGAPEAREGEK